MTLRLTTSPGRNWFIYARWAATSVSPHNVLCIQHAITRGAVINGASVPPQMQLQGSVFELHHQDPNPNGPLYLQLPLQRSCLHMPTLSKPTFCPGDLWLHDATLNASIGRDIARLAGLDYPQDMQRWLNLHLLDEMELVP